VKGGLRASLYNSPRANGAPGDLHAGDRVEALLRTRPPRNFLDPGAFDLHGYLALQRVDLTGSLRNGELLQLIGRPPPTPLQELARVRGALLARLDGLFAGQPQRAAVLRAMLLGDRSFVESDTVTAFQKIAAYHVLVVAGLHVGALTLFLFWLCRRLRLSAGITSLVTLAILAAYAGVVQDRPPILRAALMAAFYLCARPLFRRVDLLNVVALAALGILIWKPSSLTDSSFELSFLAAGVIGALAVPWLERTSAPYRAGLCHLGDVTRDGVHPPKIAQFRIEMRAAAKWTAARLPQRLAGYANFLLATPVRLGLRLWEIVLLSLVIQWGMTPLLASDFHRVSLIGPASNIPAVALTGLIVPLGFVTLGLTFVWPGLAMILGKVLAYCTGLLLASAEWFSLIPHGSYRIPEPPAWLAIAFFSALLALAAAARFAAGKRMGRTARKQLPPPIAPTEWTSAAVLLALTILIATHPFAPNLARGKLEVSVLDVGQGDSIFTAFPDGRTMLIDGGGLAGSAPVGGSRPSSDVGEEVVSPYLWSRGLEQIDVVALTHAHHDHLDGLHSILENFQVRELWVGRDEETSAIKALLAEASQRGVQIVHKVSGARFDWDGVTGEFLWPADTGPVNEASNDDSLVLRITDGRMHFLLPGDAQQRSEDELVGKHAPLAADFLKVPHHGSKTSSTEAFLAAVAPRVAVVSVGDANPFGHPAETIIERYAHDGVRLLRTDRDGAVTALTDGQNLSVQTFLERHQK
jgi:competence protein ComEC